MKIDTFLLHKVLEICNIIQGQRSLIAVYHVLVGKQNHQTWSDVHFFQLSSYYRFLTNQDEAVFYDTISYAQKQEWILEHDQLIYVTDKGRRILSNIQKEEDNRDGRIIRKMEQYWAFLHLLVQTLSHLLERNKHFYPIVRNSVIQAEVRKWLKKYGVQNGARQLYHDLKNVFAQFPDSLALLMIKRLSGAKRIAQTIEQLAYDSNKSIWETKWEWEVGLTKLYDVIANGNFSSLPKLPNKSEYLMSNSAQKTYRLLLQHKSIEEISSLRNLKATTIMDHIVEVALLDPSFDITPYIELKDIQAVHESFQKSKSFLLKSYKEIFPHLSYFQIRLALTRV